MAFALSVNGTDANWYERCSFQKQCVMLLVLITLFNYGTSSVVFSMTCRVFSQKSMYPVSCLCPYPMDAQAKYSIQMSTFICCPKRQTNVLCMFSLGQKKRCFHDFRKHWRQRALQQLLKPLTIVTKRFILGIRSSPQDTPLKYPLRILYPLVHFWLPDTPVKNNKFCWIWVYLFGIYLLVIGICWP